MVTLHISEKRRKRKFVETCCPFQTIDFRYAVQKFGYLKETAECLGVCCNAVLLWLFLRFSLIFALHISEKRRKRKFVETCRPFQIMDFRYAVWEIGHLKGTAECSVTYCDSARGWFSLQFSLYVFPCSFALSRHSKNLFSFSFRKMVPNPIQLLAIFL